jgi:tetratricopeptide (TPR) repeat protein
LKRLLIVLFVVAAGFAAVGGYVAASRERQYRTLIAVGDAAMVRADTYVAVEAFSGAIALRQQSMLPYLKRGQAYFRRGELQNAKRDLRRAMELDPTATLVLEALGDVNYALEDFEGAADRYAECVALDDATARVQYKLGLARYHAGHPAAAVAPLVRASSLDEQHAESQYVLGLALRDLNKPKEALAALSRAVKLSPALAEARAELAVLYRTLGDDDKEIEQLEALAALRPGPERAVPLGLAYARAGHMTQAIGTLGGAAEQFRDNQRVYVALGRVWLDAAQARRDRVALSKAVEALEGALTAGEPTSEALALFGRALFLAADYETSEQTLLEAVSRTPVEPAAYVYLAETAERLGHFDRATNALVSYRAIRGEEAPDSHRLAPAVRIADLALRAKDPATAAAWLRRAASANPADGRLHVRLAEAAWASGDRALARSALATASQLMPEDARVRAMQRRVGSRQ